MDKFSFLRLPIAQFALIPMMLVQASPVHTLLLDETFLALIGGGIAGCLRAVPPTDGGHVLAAQSEAMGEVPEGCRPDPVKTPIHAFSPDHFDAAPATCEMLDVPPVARIPATLDCSSFCFPVSPTDALNTPLLI